MYLKSSFRACRSDKEGRPDRLPCARFLYDTESDHQYANLVTYSTAQVCLSINLVPGNQTCMLAPSRLKYRYPLFKLCDLLLWRCISGSQEFHFSLWEWPSPVWTPAGASLERLCVTKPFQVPTLGSDRYISDCSSGGRSSSCTQRAQG